VVFETGLILGVDETEAGFDMDIKVRVATITGAGAGDPFIERSINLQVNIKH